MNQNKPFFSAEDFIRQGRVMGVVGPTLDAAARIANAKVAPLLEAMEVLKAALSRIEDNHLCLDDTSYCSEAETALEKAFNILSQATKKE